eukprot:GDKI01010998.1.p1 GENE.GDKI01010998.1~~GDKI01010998.1.p1  ORF type:complete len:158 (-),score=35.87 GDKI01010998.1:32-505(-)
MVRFKNRWIAVEIVWRDVSPPLSNTVLLDALKQSIQVNFGDLGFAKNILPLRLLYLNTETNLAIFRCVRSQAQEVWAALTFITNIQGKPVHLRVVHVGGTTKSTHEFAIRHLALWLKNAQLRLAEQTHLPPTRVCALQESLETQFQTAVKQVDAVEL